MGSRKEEVLNILKEGGGWLTTNKIANASGLHWYKTEAILRELRIVDKKVEKDEKPNTTYWRIKGEDD